jgi:hypothetical protein
LTRERKRLDLGLGMFPLLALACIVFFNFDPGQRLVAAFNSIAIACWAVAGGLVLFSYLRIMRINSNREVYEDCWNRNLSILHEMIAQAGEENVVDGVGMRQRLTILRDHLRDCREAVIPYSRASIDIVNKFDKFTDKYRSYPLGIQAGQGEKLLAYDDLMKSADWLVEYAAGTANLFRPGAREVWHET